MPWIVVKDLETLVVVNDGERRDGGGVGAFRHCCLDGADESCGWMGMGAESSWLYEVRLTVLFCEGRIDRTEAEVWVSMDSSELELG